MSNIKGGGKALLSPEAEESIVSLLYDLRSHKNPLLPKEEEGKDNENSSRILYQDLDPHEKKKKRKKFLMKLLKYHQTYELSNRLNAAASSSSSTAPTSLDGEVQENLKTRKSDSIHSTHSQINASTSNSMSQTSKHGKEISSASSSSGNDKVRIEIVEAIYKGDKGNKSSKKKQNGKSDNKEKSKSKQSWKEGSIRKVLVVAKMTNVKDLMSLSKTKLSMKKKPARMFVVDREAKIEMDLLHDLSGLENGDVVYATTYVPSLELEKHGNDYEEEEDDNDEEDNGNVENTVEKDNGGSDAILLDPLENIKRVYRMKRRNRNVQQDGPVSTSPVINNERLPPFSDSLGTLEELSPERSKLPAANHRKDVLLSLDSSRVIVIQGATGCGKSTQVPQFILEGMKAINQVEKANIIVTQPRRVAAMSLAKRVADERNCPLPGRKGSEVGYNVRLSRAICKDTKITYCTVGVLLRMIVNPMEYYGDQDGGEDADEESQPLVPLSHVTHVILDEVHERDLTTDFALTLLRPILSVNKRISIVLMSATASANLFVKFFRDVQLGIVPIVLTIPGRTFPVQVRWLNDCEKLVSRQMNGWSYEKCEKGENISEEGAGSFELSPFAREQIDYDFIVRIIGVLARQQWEEDSVKNKGLDKEDGSILVFLPGKGEIESLARALYKDSALGKTSKCLIRKLHSTLSPSEQWRAFQPVKNGIVKIVLSTNVAETSITIPDVTFVIDSGRAKEMRFNASTRINELVTVWISQASAKQREGRAGRTRSGVCYKLYSEEYCLGSMPRQTCPEIMRTPLEELVLQICLFEEQRSPKGVSPLLFLGNAPEAPHENHIHQACIHLQEIGALRMIQNDPVPLFRLTPLGYHLSHLPMDAKVGKMLVTGCILRCIEPCLTIAAILTATKSVWLSYVPGYDNSGKKAKEIHEQIISSGFGGTGGHGGTVRGDIIAAVAAYNAWASSAISSDDNADKQRRQYALKHALDHNALNEIAELRKQFRDYLRVGGLLQAADLDNINGEDAVLTSCCLVAGLYPNIATLLRPSRERRIRGGRLITKNGDSCRPSPSSFQADRVRNVGESGKDVYAVYHGKNVILGANADRIKPEPFLSDVNFVSRFAIVLFGGDIEVKKNCLIVDNWLKFKIQDSVDSEKQLADKNLVNAIMLNELKKEIDQLIVKDMLSDRAQLSGGGLADECEQVIQVVRTLLNS